MLAFLLSIPLNPKTLRAVSKSPKTVMWHSQISTSHGEVQHILKKHLAAEQMTITEIEEPIAGLVLNTALYTRACWTLIDCPDCFFMIYGKFSCCTSGISNEALSALQLPPLSS